jgi:hypothetical protein
MFVGKIYKLSNPENSKYYIGSTKQENINNRLIQHKTRYSQYIRGSGKKYTAFEVLNNNNCKIELLEEVKYNDKKELLDREKYHIRSNINNVVNKCIPNRDIKEYYKDNVDKYKKYYQDNRNKLLSYQNAYNSMLRTKKIIPSPQQ